MVCILNSCANGASDPRDVSRSIEECLTSDQQSIADLRTLIHNHHVKFMGIGREVGKNLDDVMNAKLEFANKVQQAEKEYHAEINFIVKGFQTKSDAIKGEMQKFVAEASEGNMKLAVGRIYSKMLA